MARLSDCPAWCTASHKSARIHSATFGDVFVYVTIGDPFLVVYRADGPTIDDLTAEQAAALAGLLESVGSPVAADLRAGLAAIGGAS